jgi:hypothetical protein
MPHAVSLALLAKVRHRVERMIGRNGWLWLNPPYTSAALSNL